VGALSRVHRQRISAKPLECGGSSHRFPIRLVSLETPNGFGLNRHTIKRNEDVAHSKGFAETLHNIFSL
jgi:hypothetical protein